MCPGLDVAKYSMCPELDVADYGMCPELDVADYGMCPELDVADFLVNANVTRCLSERKCVDTLTNVGHTATPDTCK